MVCTENKVKRASPVDVHVGHRLKFRRNALGMTQETLADGVGLTFQQIQKYEKGANRISASRLQQFAHILSVTVPWFFEDAPGSNEVKGTDELAAAVGEFTGLDDAHKLMKAFVRIDDKKLRRQIAQLVERLSEIG